MKQPTFYAVYVGINAYDNCRQLNGCVNDVVAAHRYFRRLCAQQSAEDQLAYQAKFLLLPHREEKRFLKQEGIDYTKPTRQNIIDAFEFFAEADPEAGDYCLLYYSGHGSYIDAPDLFRSVAPDGTLQTLVCADSRSKNGRDLVDKELGFLIAKTLEGKTELEDGKGVHFLGIFDSCHSGTVSRGDDDLVARMEQKGENLSEPTTLLGFTREGNAFYKPFEEGQTVIAKDGLKHGRYINLSACRDSEVAQERILDSYIEGDQMRKRNHGVFSFSLFRALERSGTGLSYNELMRRVQMEVRTRVGNQLPILGKTALDDKNLFFLKNQLKTPSKTYEVGCRASETGWVWYLNAGALNGMQPATKEKPSQIKLMDGSERIVDITYVKSLECILDDTAFEEADRDKNLEAIIHQMPFEQTLLAYDEQLSEDDQSIFDQIFEEKNFKFIRKANAGESAKYYIRSTRREDKKAFAMVRQGSDMPVFLPVYTQANLLMDAEQIGKWENTLLLKNEDPQIPRSDIEVQCRQLEGIGVYDPANLVKIRGSYAKALAFRNEHFSEPILNPDELHLNYKKVKGKYVAPAVSFSIKNTSGYQDYWVGVLYLDSAFGITSKNLEVQELHADAEGVLDLEFKFDRQGIHFPFIPLWFEPEYHKYGLTEITDYVIIVVAKKSFSLDDYEQAPLAVSGKRGQGGQIPDMHEDDWFTIKVPITISFPLEDVQLVAGEKKPLTALSIEAPSGFGATVNATTNARAKRVMAQIAAGRSTVNQRALLPPGALFQGAESSGGVFNSSMEVEPDKQLSILEMTDVRGQLDPSQPLKIYPDSPLAEEETILPFGYDQENDIYFPLGYTDGDGTIIIEQLPEPSDTLIGTDAVDLDVNERSIKRSIKLFFNKLVWSKLTGHHEYQTLALVKTGDLNEERMVYHGTGSGEDRESLSQMQTYIQEQTQQKGKSDVLLLVHGIIGNTDAQVDAVFKQTKIHEQFAAVFTFDYENLNTPIEKTAEHLAKCLQDLGLAENQLTIVAHSMGGLVSRQMIEQQGVSNIVRRLVQAGTPNAGSELSDFRKKITGWIGMGINGIAFIQPYLTILSFLGKGLEKRIFKTLDQMGPGSAFLTKLNSSGAASGVQAKYVLIAGDTNLIKAELLKKDPMWKKLLKALKKRGAYLFLDYLVFDDAPNDMAVKVESMKVLPDPNARVEVIDCNHLMYFSDPDSLKLLEEVVV